MLEFPRWKYALVIIIVLFSALYALPNLFPQDLAVQVSANRGGVVDEALKERVQGVLEKDSLPFKSMELDGDTLLVRTDTPDHQLTAADELRDALGNDYVVAVNLASTVPGWLSALGGKPMLLGLDLRGGVHFKMEVDQRAALDKRENGFADDIRSLL
ncbi:MAG TPA: protein translocase subunit SecD, partial [Xanthomonadaceae bacterium]|nr:protein translocase subunit SecD [Xanthomonadaceae bacterium]